MSVRLEIWVKYILNRFYKENTFLQNAYNDDQYVLAGSIVHIPQPGAAPVIVKNRNSFPATAVRRTDTDLTYVLDEYTTDPTHIVDADQYELSYSKMDSVLLDHVNGLSETVADDILIKWLSGTSNVLRTTGQLSGASLVSGQTGQRRVLLDTDLQKAKLQMNLDKIPKNDRFALLEDNMADQLFTSLSATAYKDFSAFADPTEGVVGKLHGFKIMTRSSVAIAAADDTINALGADTTDDDNVCSLIYQRDCVARAMGTVKMFQDLGNPMYYGDIYSALVRMGGRVRRTGGAGVYKLVQAAS